MWFNFILQNIHFAINLFAALVFFAVFWLYFDAWTVKKSTKIGVRWVGFILLSLSYIVQASYIETTILISRLISVEFNQLVAFLLKTSGFIMLIASLATERLQEKPGTAEEEKKDKSTKIKSDLIHKMSLIGIVGSPSGLMMRTNLLSIFYPFLCLGVAIFFLRKARQGRESHLKPIAIGFFILTLSYIINLYTLWQNTQSYDLYILVQPFGLFWILEHIVKFIAVIIFCRWVFGYLLKRFETQILIIFTSFILAVFLVVTVSFTGLLYSQMVAQNFRQLETEAKILNYTINNKMEGSLSDAQVLAQDSRIISALKNNERAEVVTIVSGVISSKTQSLVHIASSSGQIVARGEDTLRFGDSISDDPLFKRANRGENVLSVVSRESIVAPEISLKAAVPIKAEEQIIGVVMVGSVLDNAFLDGVKKATGLEASVYAGNKLSATTLLAADGTTRPIGTVLSNKKLLDKVLVKQEEFTGAVNLLNRPYFASYLPIRDIDNNSLGMIFVGRDQATILATVGRAMESTFLITIVLLVISLIPSYYIAGYITSQIR